MPLDDERFIERNPQICGGEPVIKATCLTVRAFLTSQEPTGKGSF